MKDFINLINAYQKRPISNESQLIAMAIGIEGNSFRRTASRMLINDQGHWKFERESGIADGRFLEQIQFVIKHQRTSIIDIDTNSIEGRQIGVALGCRGMIQLFLHPNTLSIVEALKQCLNEPNIRILMTITASTNKKIHAGELIICKSNNQLLTTLTQQPFLESIQKYAQQVWEKGRSDTKVIDTKEGRIKVFCEIITPQPQLILLGGQYDVYPLATMAKSIGWKVIVLANSKKLRQNIFSLVDEVLDLDEINKLHIKINQNTAFVIMSHLFERDLDYLKIAIKTTVPYIGMLGPRRRFKRMFDRLAQQDFLLTKAELARLHAPMGLDIGASTQEEMTVSIIAEIRAFFNGKQGGFLKRQEGDIHFR